MEVGESRQKMVAYVSGLQKVSKSSWGGGHNPHI
jgi:hypothetical protein